MKEKFYILIEQVMVDWANLKISDSCVLKQETPSMQPLFKQQTLGCPVRG